MYYNFTHFPDNLRSIRRSKNLTQKELADKLDISRQTIMNYEKGESHPNGIMIEQLAEALEVPIEELLTNPETKDLQEKLEQFEKLEHYEEYDILEKLEYLEDNQELDRLLSEEKLLHLIEEKVNFNFEMRTYTKDMRINELAERLGGTSTRPIKEQIQLINLEYNMKIKDSIEELYTEYLKNCSL
ncbi:helix-turn-helix transcriptional regulator [Enterococcus faecalis]|nr:helix-turn-helix transcriptional regulator [Enterococcus faecalis]